MGNVALLEHGDGAVWVQLCSTRDAPSPSVKRVCISPGCRFSQRVTCFCKDPTEQAAWMWPEAYRWCH